MKYLSASLAALLLTALPAIAETPKEKSFVESYKKAYEAKDEATLKSFLYTKGADPAIVGFYQMMMTAEAGGKLSSIELRDLTPDEVKKATEPQPSPGGADVKLTVNPTKKLVMKTSTSGPNGSSTSSSDVFVAEVDGKLVIPVPGPVK